MNRLSTSDVSTNINVSLDVRVDDGFSDDSEDGSIPFRNSFKHFFLSEATT